MKKARIHLIPTITGGRPELLPLRWLFPGFNNLGHNMKRPHFGKTLIIGRLCIGVEMLTRGKLPYYDKDKDAIDFRNFFIENAPIQTITEIQNMSNELLKNVFNYVYTKPSKIKL